MCSPIRGCLRGGAAVLPWPGPRWILHSQTPFWEDFWKRKIRKSRHPIPIYKIWKFYPNDICIFAKQNLKQPKETHLLCLKAVFFALKKANLVISLEKSSIFSKKFIFLGATWNMEDQSSVMNNDRLQSILKLRSPRSIAKCASRLSTINYYQNYIPYLKRISLCLWSMIKSG